MTPLCIVFDLDDTLFLERDYVASGFKAVEEWTHQKFGISDFAYRANHAFLNGLRGNIFDFVLQECGCHPTVDDIQSMIRVYRTHSPSISLQPDAVEFIKRFHGIVKLALITDGPFASQRRKVRALGLESFLESIIFTDVLGSNYGKPHPLAFQLIERRLGSVRSQYFYVGDNPKKDFDAPSSLNWGTVRIRRNAGLYSCSEPQGPTCPQFEISDLRALPEILRIADVTKRRARMVPQMITQSN